MNFLGAAATDIGIVKKVNQDSLTLKIAHSSWGTVCMAVICDGLGGLSYGEIASGNVIMAFDRWFKEEFLKAEQEWKQENIKEAWEELIFFMNQKIKNYGKQLGAEMGTTITAVLFMENKFYVIHVGDCRLYELKHDSRVITKDQTLVAQEVERGIISEQEALKDSRRNVLLQCIGVTENVEPCFMSGEIIPDTCYLLCSDGFRHEISPSEIYQVCGPQNNMTQKMMQDNLQSLIELNKQRGERDNISAILVRAGNTIC